MAECLDAGDKIIRHTEVESLRLRHLQREITVALPLDFLGARELKFAVVAHVIADHLAENVLNTGREQCWPNQPSHAPPAP